MQNSITPYITVRDAAAALDFYARALGANETMRLPGPDGRIGHAEISVGGAMLMLSEEYPDYGAISPSTLNGTTAALHLLVPNVDELVNRAVAAGARLERPVADQFYGMRSGTIVDPFGHRWMIATEIEKLTNEQVVERAKQAMGAQG